MQNQELNKVKAKIFALTQKTAENGCTEHEAMAAMAMVGRLLMQYNLSMSEIDVREQVCRTVFIQTGRKNRHPIDSCIIALAGLFDAKCWLSAKYDLRVKATSYAFFGQENDLLMIEYLYKVILSAIDTESQNFKGSDIYAASLARKTAFVSFQRGMAIRISQRLVMLKREQEKEMEEAEKVNAETNPEYTGSRALIVLKSQLIKEEFEKENIKLRTISTTHRANNYSAFSAGHAAGNKVNLSRPLTNGNSGNLCLT